MRLKKITKSEVIDILKIIYPFITDDIKKELSVMFGLNIEQIDYQLKGNIKNKNVGLSIIAAITNINSKKIAINQPLNNI